MASLKLPELTDKAILGHVDPHTYHKGEDYYQRGRVTLQAVTHESPNGYFLEASVKGSAAHPYGVFVTFIIRNNQLVPIDSECECPLEGYCKHVAAVLLCLRDTGLQSQLPDWRHGLQALLPAEEAVNAELIPLALLFEVREHRYGSYYGYGNNRAVRVEHCLIVRLATPSPTTGKWVVNQLTWNDIITKYGRTKRLAPAQVSALHALWSLYSAERNDYDNTILKLDSFANPRLWDMLAEAKQSGIALLTAARHNPPVQLDHTCRLELAVAEEAAGDLRLNTQLILDNKKANSDAMQKIGNPPVGFYWSTGPKQNLKQHEIHIARFSEIPQPFLLQAWQDKASLTIPVEDKVEFSTEYFPRIARQVPVDTRKVSGLKLELPQPPKLYLSVTNKSTHDLSIKLGFSYNANGQSIHLPYGEEMPDSRLTRDRPEENRLTHLLTQYVSNYPEWFEAVPTGVAPLRSLKPKVVLHGAAIISFVQELLPALQAEADFIVDLPAGLPDYRLLEGAPDISYEISSRDDGSSDWFNLAVQVSVGGVRVPFESLFTALADNEPALLLDDGNYLRLEHPELQKLRHLILEARSLNDKDTSGELSLSRFQASLWDELQALGVVKKQAEAWDTAVRGLLDVAFIPKVAVPKSLKAKLRPYQKSGYQWLHFLWSHSLGGILADDMGLGKTLQTIALLLAIKQATPKKDQRPALIIAPTSVAANWASELALFAPSLNVAYVRSVSRDGRVLSQHVKGMDIVVSSYGLFRLDFDSYQAQQWSSLILDEAQFVKNHQSKGYQNARKLNAPFKLALSGTPLENNLMELWSLLSIVAPGLFPSPKHFADFYQKPVEKEADTEKLQQLRKRVRPLLLRCTKDQVVRELPAKIEQTIELELNPRHRKVYDIYLQRERQRVLGLLGDMQKNRFMIFKSLTTLRLLSLAPSLVDAKKYQDVPSTKLDSLITQLQEILAEKHRVLIFSQFTSFLKLVRNELDKQATPYLYLDGSTKNRGKLLQTFKTSEVPVFVISLKAGGFGLNLTEADYCFLLDPWWNPAVEQQAIDRTHRIGQTKQVIVYRFVAVDTIEEKVMALKAKKSKLFASMLDEGAAFSADISAEDVKELFT